jgi:hypothetical protein
MCHLMINLGSSLALTPPIPVRKQRQVNCASRNIQAHISLKVYSVAHFTTFDYCSFVHRRARLLGKVALTPRLVILLLKLGFNFHLIVDMIAIDTIRRVYLPLATRGTYLAEGI